MSSAMLNQGLFEEQDFSINRNRQAAYNSLSSLQFLNCIATAQSQHVPLIKTLVAPFSPAADDSSHLTPSSDQSLSVITKLKEPQDYSSNYWAWGEFSDSASIAKRVGVEDHLVVSGSTKTTKGRRKIREPRFSFKTMSEVDILDDGYKWRKYGQKIVKNTQHPRSYYRCTQVNCRVKKRVERLEEDPRMVITTYEGRHVHSPLQDEDDFDASTKLTNLFW